MGIDVVVAFLLNVVPSVPLGHPVFVHNARRWRKERTFISSQTGSAAFVNDLTSV